MIIVIWEQLIQRCHYTVRIIYQNSNISDYTVKIILKSFNIFHLSNYIISFKIKGLVKPVCKIFEK